MTVRTSNSSKTIGSGCGMGVRAVLIDCPSLDDFGLYLAAPQPTEYAHEATFHSPDADQATNPLSSV